MSKPKLVSIFMYEEMNKIWVGARFKNEAIRCHLKMINVNFSLPKEDPRSVAEIEELATAKAEEFLEKMSSLMNDLVMPKRLS